MNVPRRRHGDADVYLGPGGKLVQPRSESNELRRLAGLIDQARKHLFHGNSGKAESALERATLIAERLEHQAEQGYHRNPGLMIYGNPPLRVRNVAAGRIIGQIAQDVHEIRYQHADDGKAYRHPFEGGVLMFAVERGGQRDLHITHSDGKPLWEDF